jgi:hypothetical protein
MRREQFIRFDRHEVPGAVDLQEVIAAVGKGEAVGPALEDRLLLGVLQHHRKTFGFVAQDVAPVTRQIDTDHAENDRDDQEHNDNFE